VSKVGTLWNKRHASNIVQRVQAYKAFPVSRSAAFTPQQAGAACMGALAHACLQPRCSPARSELVRQKQAKQAPENSETYKVTAGL
jgi:hypothetical protein